MPKTRPVNQLLEILMSSVNSNMVPVELGWKVFEKFKTGELETEEGFTTLLRACRKCEPVKTKRALEGEKV